MTKLTQGTCTEHITEAQCTAEREDHQISWGCAVMRGT